ncbi:hypothetical protein GCM10009122_50520 [Fulvivirga kasyanovii]|uniref:hypothetical protein n=1 Tax=Fulvivirga kasyanovii TaxID=396812 RepID=UPI0031D28FB5
MPKIVMKGWLEGLEKVSLSLLQVNLLGLSLKESKSNVDLLLDDEEVIIQVGSLELANKFIKEAKSIGVICEVKK